MRAAINLLLLAVLWALLVDDSNAAAVDHYSISPISTPQRVCAPLTVTVSAVDSNGVVVTNFAGPVQLFYTNNPTPAYFNDFSGGFQFDTDGDATSDGAEWRIISGTGQFNGTYGFNLQSNSVYWLSLDQALSPGGTGQLLFAPDAVLYSGFSPVQIGSWGGWFTAGQVSRFYPYIEFGSGPEGAYTLMLRYWLPLGGSTSIYTDNIKVRLRDISPGFVLFQNGQWTGDLTLYYEGTNVALRALDNHNRSGDSSPFDVLPRLANISVSMLPHDFLPVGQNVWINFQLSNSGPSSIEGVIVTNEIPADLTFIQGYPYDGTRVDSTHIVSVLPAIAGGSSVTFSLIVQRALAGPALVSATLMPPSYDPDPSNQSVSGSVVFVPVLSGTDVTVTEAPGGTNATFQLSLNAPSPQDLAVNYTVLPLSATPGVDFILPPPGTLVFPAGTTLQSLVVPILDDVFFEGDEQFAVNLSLTNGAQLGLGQTNFVCTIVSDDPLPTITVLLPSEVLETAGTLTNGGSLNLSAPFEQDLTLTIVSSNPARLISPGSFLLSAGQTNFSFNLQLINDAVWNPTQTITLTATCTNGMSGSAPISIINEDPPALSITTSIRFIEGQGTVTNGLRINIPFSLSTNISVSLTSSNVAKMTVPEPLVIHAGATFANASPTVVDNTLTDGPQNVTLTATAPGFINGLLVLSVADNDLHHFQVGAEQGSLMHSQTSTIPFSISIIAKDVATNTLTGFTQAAALSATSDLGNVILSPAVTGPFVRGSWFGSITISNGDFTNVRIVATETNGGGHAGQSPPFRVYASPAQRLQILSTRILGQDVQLQFNSVAGRNYRLESASNSVSAWNTNIPSIIGLGGSMTVTNLAGANAPRQFYRFVLQP